MSLASLLALSFSIVSNAEEEFPLAGIYDDFFEISYEVPFSYEYKQSAERQPYLYWKWDSGANVYMEDYLFNNGPPPSDYIADCAVRDNNPMYMTSSNAFYGEMLAIATLAGKSWIGHDFMNLTDWTQ